MLVSKGFEAWANAITCYPHPPNDGYAEYMFRLQGLGFRLVSLI